MMTESTGLFDDQRRPHPRRFPGISGRVPPVVPVVVGFYFLHHWSCGVAGR